MTRAAPLPPGERREAILDAVLPLVVEEGRSVSTRRLAEAAGVAEGTIFRVFATKQELLDEVVSRALSSDRVLSALSQLPGDALPRLINAIVAILQDHARLVHRLIPLVRADDRGRAHPHRRHDANDRVLAAIATALSPHASALRVSLPTAAGAIFALSFGTSFSTSGPVEKDTVVDILLHGIAHSDRKA